MQSTIPASVVWIGSREDPAFHRLAVEFSRRGLKLKVCETGSELARLLSRRSKAVLVIRDGDSCAALADAALAALESLYRPVPVVVLADESAFGRYYELMGRGVQHYCGLSEGPSRIASIVQHTAAHAA